LGKEPSVHVEYEGERVPTPVWTPIIGKLKRGERGWKERERESERGGGRKTERKIVEKRFFFLWRNIPSRA
jgi:hypothetical protein